MARMWKFQRSTDGPWDWDVLLLDGTRIGSLRTILHMGFQYWTYSQNMVDTKDIHWTRTKAASVLYHRYKQKQELLGKST